MIEIDRLIAPAAQEREEGQRVEIEHEMVRSAPLLQLGAEGQQAAQGAQVEGNEAVPHEGSEAARGW